MKFNLSILFLDGTTKEVTAIAADLVAFEAKFDLSISKLEAELRLTHLLFLAWHAEKRTKSTGLEFEAWTETVDNVGVAEVKK